MTSNGMQVMQVLCRFLEACHPEMLPTYTLTQLRRHLCDVVKPGGWSTWVQASGSAIDEELAMCKGPSLRLTLWNKMEIQDTVFLTQRGEGRRKGACNSLVLTYYTDHVTGVKQPYIGRVQSFMTQEAPWAVGTYAERQNHVVRIADAKWYAYKGSRLACYNAPVYTRAFKPEFQGDFWGCELLEPTPITLGPYEGTEYSPKSQLHQVIVWNVQVFKPDVSYQVHPSFVQDVDVDRHGCYFLRRPRAGAN